jgi:hypothetical protein
MVQASLLQQSYFLLGHLLLLVLGQQPRDLFGVLRQDEPLPCLEVVLLAAKAVLGPAPHDFDFALIEDNDDGSDDNLNQLRGIHQGFYFSDVVLLDQVDVFPGFFKVLFYFGVDHLEGHLHSIGLCDDPRALLILLEKFLVG